MWSSLTVELWDPSSLHLTVPYISAAAFCWSPGTVGPPCLLSRVVNIVSVDPDFKESGLFVNFEAKIET